MLAGFWGKVRAYLFPSEEKASPQQQEDYFSLVEQARLEWHKAKDAFDQVSDPELIDHAVYNLEAAERRYIYLLKKAKEEGVNLYGAERGK
ncbi:MAG: DUF2508 family protein [Firmicutes bacterium]|nr:DUF2508 family protein [Bacillota bacterium]